MSELQESQRPNSASARSGAGPAPKPNPSNMNPAVPNGASQGVSGVTDEPTQPYTPVFTADKIHETKAKKPREFFDEQNRKTAAQKEKNAQNRKKLIVILVGIAIVFVVIIAVWLIILKVNQPNVPSGSGVPTISDGSNEELNDVRQYLQNVYNDTDGDDSGDNSSNTKLEAANEAAEEILNHGDNAEYADQIKMAQVVFYTNNGYYNEAIELSNQINADNLLPEQQATYYNTLSQAYYGVGDTEKANEYFLAGYVISMESGDNLGGSSDD